LASGVITRENPAGAIDEIWWKEVGVPRKFVWMMVGYHPNGQGCPTGGPFVFIITLMVVALST
jgi:hypothetical protein